MFYHVRHFTLLCLPKGGLLLSNRLSLKKSLEEATEELRRLWKGQLWRERRCSAEALPTRRAGAEQSSKHRGGSSWRCPSRGGSRLIRSRRPKKKHAKVDEKCPKSCQNGAPEGSREHFWRPEAQDGRQGGKKTDFDAQKCAPRVPKWVTKGSKNALKRCLKTSCFLDPFFESFWPAFEVKMEAKWR